MYDFSLLDALLRRGLDERCFPSAVCAVGDRSGVKYTNAVGFSRLFTDDAPCFDVIPEALPDTAVPADMTTRFDLASLSKLTAATMCVLRLIEMGEISLYDTVGRVFADAPDDKRGITVEQLMTHTSGISAHFRLSKSTDDPSDAARVILAHPLSSAVGSKVEYSCMGFILLGRMLEKLYGTTLDRLARELVFAPLGMTGTGYCPSGGNFAATEYDSESGRYLCGTVHDENARFLGGVSANAGVFSDIADMSKFALMLSNRGETENGRFLGRRMFDTAVSLRTAGLNDSRGLGFQLKGNALSPAGDLFAVGSYGHTGFTGTSLYVDCESGVFSVLLTNRVHFTRRSDRLFRFRRVWHNAVIGCMGV